MLPGIVKDPARRLLIHALVVPYLRWRVKKAQSIDELVSLAYSFHEGLPLPARLRRRFSITPLQVREEIMELLRLLARMKPKTVMEIGTASGGTLFLFAGVADPEALIISVDLPGGPFGGGYPEWRIPLYKGFARGRQRIVLLRGDSHDSETLREVERILAGRKLDFLFIDGDHTYQGVRKDFEMYSPLVRKGGIIAFHDIAPHPPETGAEVDKFWNEIKHNYRHLEIVKDWRQGWAGIGVIYV